MELAYKGEEMKVGQGRRNERGHKSPTISVHGKGEWVIAVIQSEELFAGVSITIQFEMIYVARFMRQLVISGWHCEWGCKLSS